MVSAIEDRVILVFSFVDEVMGNQLAGYALRFVLFVIGAKDFQLGPVTQFREQALLKDVRVVGNQDVSGF